MSRLLLTCGLALAVVLPLAASADETALALAPAPEAALVRAHSSGCHSLDYILMNSPFPARALWEAEVRKMIKVMGAPIPDEDVAKLVDYLTTHYGTP
jgi:hypothetical protein